jgi:hypothetical protein
MMKKLLLFCLLSPVFRDDVAPDGTSLRRNLGHWLASVWPGHTMRYTRPRLLIFPDIGPHIFLEDGAMNFTMRILRPSSQPSFCSSCRDAAT